MQEIAQQVLANIQANPVVAFGIALLAGFSATRLVAAERRPGVVGSIIVGFMGFFLGNLALTYFRLTEYLDNLHALRIFIDFFVAFLGSFVIAGIIHFFKPT